MDRPPVTLVLLPGLDGTGQLFRWLVEALPPQIEPMVVSFAPDDYGDYASLEARVAPLLPQDRPFVLLGESFSGPLALRLAARRPDNLKAVVLVASFVARPIGWMSVIAAPLVRPFLFRLPVPIFLLRWLLLGAEPPAKVTAAVLKSVRAVAPAVLAARCRAALTVDVTEAFKQCWVPMLYLGGRRDRLISAHVVQRMKAARPDLECKLLDAPHFVLQCAAVAAVDAIAAFVRQQLNAQGTLRAGS